jgi:hypothetical protein
VVEGHGLAAVGEQPLVEDVEQLEERHVGADTRHVVLLELPGRGRPFLAPHPQLQVHALSFSCFGVNSESYRRTHDAKTIRC